MQHGALSERDIEVLGGAGSVGAAGMWGAVLELVAPIAIPSGVAARYRLRSPAPPAGRAHQSVDRIKVYMCACAVAQPFGQFVNATAHSMTAGADQVIVMSGGLYFVCHGCPRTNLQHTSGLSSGLVAQKR